MDRGGFVTVTVTITPPDGAPTGLFATVNEPNIDEVQNITFLDEIPFLSTPQTSLPYAYL